jgi:hypothetical protein
MKARPRQTENLYRLYASTRDNTPFKSGAKDGSIPTHPVVPCPDIKETGKNGVTKQCCDWLKVRRILHKRRNVGAGSIDGNPDRFYSYGTKGAADIWGILPNGRHFEIETKAGKGGRLSKDQQDFRKEILTTEAIYVIVHGIPELEYYFKGLI